MSAYIHPTAVVDEGAKIGEGTKVWHFCHIEGTAKVGAGCSIGQNGYVGQHVTIGDGCQAAKQCERLSGRHAGPRGILRPQLRIYQRPDPPRPLSQGLRALHAHRGGGRRQHRGQRYRGLRPPNRALRHDRCRARWSPATCRLMSSCWACPPGRTALCVPVGRFCAARWCARNADGAFFPTGKG